MTNPSYAGCAVAKCIDGGDCGVGGFCKLCPMAEEEGMGNEVKQFKVWLTTAQAPSYEGFQTVILHSDFLALRRERDVLVEDLTRILNKQLLTQGVDGEAIQEAVDAALERAAKLCDEEPHLSDFACRIRNMKARP